MAEWVQWGLDEGGSAELSSGDGRWVTGAEGIGTCLETVPFPLPFEAWIPLTPQQTERNNHGSGTRFNSSAGAFTELSGGAGCRPKEERQRRVAYGKATVSPEPSQWRATNWTRHQVHVQAFRFPPGKKLVCLFLSELSTLPLCKLIRQMANRVQSPSQSGNFSALCISSISGGWVWFSERWMLPAAVSAVSSAARGLPPRAVLGRMNYRMLAHVCAHQYHVYVVGAVTSFWICLALWNTYFIIL